MKTIKKIIKRRPKRLIKINNHRQVARQIETYYRRACVSTSNQ